MRSRYGRCSSLTLLAVVTCTLLAGCSREGGRAVYAAEEQAKQAAETASTCSAATPPKVIDYGPRDVAVGHAFNTQSDGSSALWIRLDRPMKDGDAVISLDGTSLVTTGGGNVVTAIVPLELIQRRGTLSLMVSCTGDLRQAVHSAPSPFVVR